MPRVITDQTIAIRRLAQYRPFERGGASVREAQEDLVTVALAEMGGKVSSIGECAEAIQTLFTINLDEVEVARSLNELVKADKVRRADGGFHLSPNETARLDQVASDSAELTERAFAQWHSFLVERWPGLTEDEIERLDEELRLFLRQVMYRHGAEAALLLYPNEQAAQALYDALEDEGLGFLPADDVLGSIRMSAFSHFVRRPTDDQRRWLGQRLNTTYFWTVLTIDPEGAQLVRNIAQGQRVYLDTNLIYRILGIQGPRYLRPALTILETTQNLGYQCCVTPWTVAEFRQSLSNARDYLRLYPLPPTEYADLLAEATSDDDFVTAYWRKAKTDHVRVDDFFAHYNEVEELLSGLRVDVIDEGCTAIEQRTDEVDDQISLLTNVLHGKYRHEELLRHDVRHRLLIEKLRGSANRRFANAGYWFLTFDSVLPRFDVHARRASGADLPFCVSGGAWFQIVEALRPKTTDDEQTLADLLASPYVRYRRELSKQTAQAIAARVHLHEGGSPDLAARIMMNSAFVDDIESATTPDKQQEKIDNAIVQAAQQAQEDARRAQEEALKAREAAASAEAKAQDEIRDLEIKRTTEAEVARDRLEQVKQNERDRAARLRIEDKDRYDAKLDDLQSEVAAARTEARTQKRKLRGIAAVLTIFVLALGITLAFGLDAVPSIAIVVATVLGSWAAIDQLWIRR